MKKMKSMKNALHELAVEARERAHAPYSQHQIGAALVTTDGGITSGCNIENASYGGTVCAERVAIWKAVSELGNLKIKEICVVSDAYKPWPPCGMCRQVIAEFAGPDTLVHVGNLKEIKQTYKFKDLLPEAFTPGFLKKLTTTKFK